MKEPIGYIIMEDVEFRYKSIEDTEWTVVKMGPRPMKRLYLMISSANEAAKQLQENRPSNKYEVKPVHFHENK